MEIGSMNLERRKRKAQEARKKLTAGGILLAGVVLSGAANALVIEHSISHQGGNQFEYTYDITNDQMASGIEEFAIYFSVGDYGSLSVTQAPSDWDVLTIQPDNALPDDGFVDLLALSAPLGLNETLAGLKVSFNWFGAGSPGSQFFEVFDPLTFDVLGSGSTIQKAVTHVPEPAGLSILGLAMLLLGRRLRKA